MKRFTLMVVFLLGGALAGSYVVQPGDTLWRISTSQGVELTVLILANRLQSTAIKPGQELLIPERYRVRRGDTLWSLAKRFATSVAELQRLNGLHGNALREGQLLWVTNSGGATPPEPSPTDIARSYLGRPYRWGAAGPAAFDCSGFVQFVYRQLGVSLPRTTRALWKNLPPEPAPQPGDLVFFSFSGKGADHVGIYLGERAFIHANSWKRQVVVESLDAPWYKRVYIGARKARINTTQATH